VRILPYVLSAAIGATVAAIVISLTPGAPGRDSLSASQAKSVEGIIEAYLGGHPEVVAKALEQLQEQQKSADLAATRAVIKDKRDAIFLDPADLVLGNPNGDVTVVEFFDYRCPYCKRALPGIMESLKSDGRIRLVLKEFPILGPNSVLATRAALAAQKQGKYGAFHLALLGSASALDETTIKALAANVGLDTERLAQDMKDPAIDAIIKKNRELAEALKIEGTPAFIIGDELVPGAVDKAAFDKYVQQARSKG
jgi:protein-disulfide isomerase